jgi:DNA repair exonuclease SbcCD ATPase subunit
MPASINARGDPFIDDNFIYLPLIFDEETDQHVSSSGTTIESLDTLEKSEAEFDVAKEVNGRVYSPTISLDSIVSNYRHFHPQKYNELKEAALDELMDDIKDDHMPLDNKLETIIFDVMPYFIDTRQGIDETTTTEDSIIQLISEEAGADIEDYYGQVDELFSIDEIEERVMRAEEGVSGAREYDQPIQGQVSHSKLNDWVENAVKEQAIQDEIDQLKNSLEERRQFTDRNRDQLATLFLIQDRGELEIQDLGFEEMDNGEYRVYVNTGEYALRGRGGELYAFPPAEIGVYTDQLDNPKVFDHYKHPFLKYEEDHQGICLYNASPPSNHFNAENLIESIETALNVIFHGYFNHDTHWGYHSLDGDHHASHVPDSIQFDDYRVSEQYVEENDLEIKNDFIETR